VSVEGGREGGGEGGRKESSSTKPTIITHPPLPPSLPQPANIFLKAGLYKLGDFGLVASVNSSDGLGDCLQEGDSRYMSAELLQDGPKDLTKCDIFSLGATVYEICRGRALPPNGEEWHVLRSGTLPALEYGVLEAGSELMRVLTQMMAVSREGGRGGGRGEREVCVRIGRNGMC